MKTFLLSALAAACAALPARGHEFWLQPIAPPEAPTTVPLAIRVGMDFDGEPRPIDRTLVTGLRRFDARAEQDLLGRVPAQGGPTTIGIELPSPGTHVLALETRAKSITIEADKFTEYLREEGLDVIIAAREAAGRSAAPGRERYSRCVKTLVPVGPDSDAASTRVLGQTLELTPLADPFRLPPGGTLALRVTFDGRPLPGALVRAWHRQSGQLRRQEARTDAAGTVAFALDRPGDWMFSLVHMVAVTDDPQHDWQSYWGNLTFQVPAP